MHNAIISNVPGPPFPLYYAGAELVAAYPLGPVMEGCGLNITVFSYRESVDIGFMVCPELVTDVWGMADAVDEALAELLAAAAAEEEWKATAPAAAVAGPAYAPATAAAEAEAEAEAEADSQRGRSRDRDRGPRGRDQAGSSHLDGRCAPGSARRRGPGPHRLSPGRSATAPQGHGLRPTR